MLLGEFLGELLVEGRLYSRLLRLLVKKLNFLTTYLNIGLLIA